MHGNAGPLRDRRIVGEVAAAALMRSFMGGKNRLEPEALRGLRGEEPVAVDGARDDAGRVSALQRVGNRQRRQRAAVRLDGGDDPRQQRFVDEGPDAVMDQHLFGRIGGERKQRQARRGLP